jgi:hypothetical protein
MAATARWSDSTKVAGPAPRDRASMPIAPVPAKRSSTRAPSRRDRLASEEKTASRTRSVVGRTARPVGARSRRPPAFPATTRIGPT